MMTDTEIAAFVNKFLHLLNTGQKARLVLQCESMHAGVSLDVQLPAHQQEDPLHHRRGAAGPSRLRRRERRAAAARYRDRAGRPHPPADRPGSPPSPDDRAGPHHPPADKAGNLPQVEAAKAGHPLIEHPAERENHAPLHQAHPHQTFPLLPATPHNARTEAHRRRRLDSLPDVHPQSGNLPSSDPLPQVDQAALPQADHPADDVPPKEAGDPADSLQAGHPPVQLRSDLLTTHPTTPSYSAVVQTSPKTPARASDLPGSPAGWGAVDPTRAESDSESVEEESSTPQMLNVWHSPTPVRQMLTIHRPMCTPDPHPPPAQQPLTDSSQPPRAQAASLHHVIQALHERAAQSTSNNACFATPRKRRQYGSAYCLEQTSGGIIRHELTSKKQLARRGGYWDVLAVDSDQSDSEEED